MILIAKPLIGEEEKKAVMEVLSSGMLIQGSKVEEFEQKFAKFIGVKYAITTSSGTTALHLALLASGIKGGDEVITTPFTFISTANSILFCKAKPVFVDIDERTFNIDPGKIEEKITEKTKAILPVHLYGQPANMDPIIEIAEEHDLMIIGDAAQAHGARYNGKMVGSLADMGCFSFYPTKNMTTGEGGMITTNDDKIAEIAKCIRNHGSLSKYNYSCLGYNYRMTDIAAAIGIEQLKKLDKFNKDRKENAEYLNKGLVDMDGVEIPYVLPGVEHVYHQYTIKCQGRDELARHLEKNGIGFGIYYPKPLHWYPHLKKFGDKNLRIAEEVAKKVISLPVHPSVEKKDLDEIIGTIEEYVEGCG